MKNLHGSPLLILTALVCLAACGSPNRPSPKNPVALTVWPTMSGPMLAEFDILLDDFNSGLGRKEGISVSVSASTKRELLDEMLLMAASDEPGIPALPDMAVVYPNTAAALAKKGLLADFRDLLSAEELALYVEPFLDEGRLGAEGGIYLLPLAKSTEVLFVNATLFNRFAEEYALRYGGRRPGLEDLETFEGIMDLAEKYYRLTDARTPAAPNDGLAFFFPESPFNFFITGFKQLGEPFFIDGRINRASPVFSRIDDMWRKGTAGGYIPVFSGFGNNLAKSAAIICAAASSSGGLYYPNSVTYLDNTKEAVEFMALPYPVFAGGKKAAIQRGGGMALFKSTALREYAAALFLKWFTAPEQNLRFAAATGYMPVQKAAFDMAMKGGLEIKNPIVRSTFNTVVEMNRGCEFFVPSVPDDLDMIQDRFNRELREAAGGRL